LFFCDGRKLMEEGKRKVLRECGKKEEKKNAREQRGTRMMTGERTAAVSDKFRYTCIYINTWWGRSKSIGIY
jgi:hypothetical protein